MLAIIIVLAVGSLIIVSGFNIDVWYHKFQLWHHRGKNERLKLVFDGTYQLQRLAHENAGVANWEEENEENVPITRNEAAIFRHLDYLHPRNTPAPSIILSGEEQI